MLGTLLPIACVVSAYVGYRVGSKKHHASTMPELTHDEKLKRDKIREQQEGINKVMAYSVEKAHSSLRKG